MAGEREKEESVKEPKDNWLGGEILREIIKEKRGEKKKRRDKESEKITSTRLFCSSVKVSMISFPWSTRYSLISTPLQMVPE